MKYDRAPLILTDILRPCANPGCLEGKVEWFMWQAGVKYCSPACSELAELQEEKSDETLSVQYRSIQSA